MGEYTQLPGLVKSYPSSCIRRWRSRGNPKIHTSCSRKNWPGIKSKEEPQRYILGRSVPCNRNKKRSSFVSMPCLHCLNMVRAGVVAHPSEWAFSGYTEIQEPRQRYALIDYKRLPDLLGVHAHALLKDAYRRSLEESLRNGNHARDHKWSQTIDVGSKDFVEKTKEQLGIRAKRQKLLEMEDGYQLREPVAPYAAGFALKNATLWDNNTYLWNVYPEISI